MAPSRPAVARNDRHSQCSGRRRNERLRTREKTMTAQVATQKRLPFIDRLLTLWIFVAMAP
jgi:hypothetical protein